MKIGIVSYWFNRGQAVVGRHIRSILDELGHETFILARPAPDGFFHPRKVENRDVWDQPEVTVGSRYDLEPDEYVSWADRNQLEAAFFDQNYQFDAIRTLRISGIRTIGRFVWESFKPEHAEPAREAFDVIYSLTRCGQARYETLGIGSPWIPWGCPPDLFRQRQIRPTFPISFFYPGGWLGKRKPTQIVVDAFTRVKNPNIRLVVKCQRPLTDAVRIPDDPRIRVVAEDLSATSHYELMGSCHVCLCPSRWEGLGLHLYEATALNMPMIVNDIAPLNEVVHTDVNGVLVASTRTGETESGVPAFEPEPEALRDAIERISDPTTLETLSEGARTMARERSWDRTIEGYRDLLALAPHGK